MRGILTAWKRAAMDKPMNTTDTLSSDARAIFQAGVAAADPYHAVLNALEIHDGEWAKAAKVHVIAAGKGAIPMIEAALEFLPHGKIADALAVTNYENVRDVEGVTVIGASHPLPDENGAEGARRIETIAHAAGASDLVLCLISGGASALLPAPADGITLDEKIRANDLLLKSGADIVAMNTVRKALSRLKGGGLARAIAPAQGLALILSDVPGDDLAIIASGPTVPDPAEPGKALEIVRAFGLETKMPASVMAHLEKRAVRAKAGFRADDGEHPRRLQLDQPARHGRRGEAQGLRHRDPVGMAGRRRESKPPRPSAMPPAPRRPASRSRSSQAARPACR